MHCEGPITTEECERVIKQMSDSKMPGLDGLPKEFYVFAFKDNGKSFVRLLNHYYSEGTLLPHSDRDLYNLHLL